MSEPEVLNVEHPVLACSGLQKTFVESGNKLQIFRDIDFSIQSGEQVAIVGASGSGKSTLLHILGGLDKPTAGEVCVNGQTLNALSDQALGKIRNRSLGFVYQFHHLLAEFSALENVAFPLLVRRVSVIEARKVAANCLDRVGLGERLTHKPAQLSGGERQRVAIARALVGRPQCVLADEPTGNLDPKTAEQVYDTFRDLSRELGISFLVVTHDHDLADKMDRKLLLHEGHLSDAIIA